MRPFRMLRRRLLGSVTALTMAAGFVTATPHGARADDSAICPVFTTVALGENHGLALAADGTVWAWGSNGNGELGDGSTASRTSAYPVVGLHGVTAIDAGGGHSLAIAGGSVHTWGRNSSGQLGLGDSYDRTRPQRVPGLDQAVQVAAGTDHSIALASGAVLTWGENSSGQLGNFSTTDSATPVSVGSLGATSAIAAGGAHSLAIAATDLYGWGSSSDGQLNWFEGFDRPRQIRDGGVMLTAGGARHTLALVEDRLLAVGSNVNGQLGDASTTSSSDWRSVSGLDSGDRVVTQLSAGSEHSMALVDGAIYAWGDNGQGQVGDGTVADRSVPVRVSGVLGAVTSIAAGGFGSAAVVNGIVKTWGNGALTPVDLVCSGRPALVAVADGPDPVPAGEPVVFTGTWTSNDPGRSARLVVCYGELPGSCWSRSIEGASSTARIATATLTTSTDDVGENAYTAYVCDGSDACSTGVHGKFTVLPPVSGFPSDSCDVGGTNVVSGFVGAAYVKARWQEAPGGEGIWVCVAAESGATHLGGRVTLGGGVSGDVVAVDQDGPAVQSCTANANNVPVQSGTVLGGQPYSIQVTPAPVGSPDAAWVCVRFTASLGIRLRFAAGQVGVPSFAADAASPHVPPYASAPWPAPGPSATCADAVAGPTRYVDLRVGDVPVALYGWTESPMRTHLCLRAGGAGGTGGRLTVEGQGVSGVTVGSTTAPCPFDIATRSEPPSYGLYISDPNALPGVPASACAAVAGSAMSVTVSTPSVTAATWSPDPV